MAGDNSKAGRETNVAVPCGSFLMELRLLFLFSLKFALFGENCS